MPPQVRAQVSLAAIRNNLDAIRERVGSDRLVLAAVKANAYGHGAVACSLMLQRTRAADWLGVALVEEALQLRAAGVSLPILRFGPTRGEDDLAAALTAGVVLTVADEAGVDAAAQAARTLGSERATVHLKVDTGMRRVGVEPADAPRLAERIDDTGVLDLGGVYSHLPISDVPEGAAFTLDQIARFDAAVAAVERARGPVPIKHLANSGGVLGYPTSWYDLVRPGVMVYGNYPDPETEHTVDLLPALRLTTEVSFLKPVSAGESVGYGRSWTAPADTWIATIPVGYGDGYSRRLSSRGRVLIDGTPYPIAGRVCMDQTMIDLGPDPTVAVGDEVVLIGRSGGEEITVAEVAELMGTITYEVTCLITGRVERTYE